MTNQVRDFRESFVSACMFRETPAPIDVSLRMGEECEEHRAWVEPLAKKYAITRLIRLAGEDLTTRQRDVLLLVARGKSNEEIAGELGLAAGTVRTYLQQIREELGIERSEAMLAAAMGWRRLGEK